MLTIAVAVLNVVCFPVGYCVDKFGPPIVGIVGSFILSLGSLLFAVSDSENFDMYIPGMEFFDFRFSA